MSKRKISQHQQQRILRKQETYQTAIRSSSNDDLQSGLVIARFGPQALIEDAQGQLARCAIRPNIDSLTAGDRVIFQTQDAHHGVIVSRTERQSVLGRPDARGHFKAMAANITQILIVVAPLPAISWLLLDSYLIMADYLKIPACIVLNKTDLVCESILQTLTKDYVPLGYSLILHAQTEGHQSSLQQQLQHEVSVFVGQSGVGKSSLIARVLPEHAHTIQTQAISSASQLGCHTTRNARYYHLPTGGAVIDSPGVRELSLWHMSATDLAYGYREFIPWLGQCKFRNCEHQTSPGCAIVAAVKKQLISSARYENYVKIANNRGSLRCSDV